jgi:hypothetical protein
MPTLLTTREAAQRCGCSPDTFLKRSKRANIHPLELRTTTRAGRTYYWRASDITPLLQPEPGPTAPKRATQKEARAIATDRAARRALVRQQQLERWRQYYRTRAAQRAANRTPTTTEPTR